MSRGPATFRQSDLERAVRATVKAGIQVARVEIDRAGKIVVVTSHDSPAPATGRNEWDEIG